VPRHPDPDLEQRILNAASRLWSRGGEKALTMRAVAKHAGTTTPTVYERYRDREDILRAVRMQTRQEMFAALTRTRTVREAVKCKLEFALTHRHTYEMLVDGVAKPPALHETWLSFNFMRERLAEHLGGTAREHTRLALAIWSLTYGTAMLIIRGRFEGALRAQTLHACLDAIDAILDTAQSRQFPHSGPKWPSNLILGEGRKSRMGNENGSSRPRNKNSSHRSGEKKR
jgi:AcrR family transcriptional regulator